MKSILLNIDFLFPWDEVYWRRKEQGIFCRELYIVLLSMLCYLVKGVNVLFSPFKLWSEEPQGDDMLTLGTTVCISPVVFSRPKFINHPKMYRSIWDQGTNLSNNLDYTEDFRSKFHDFSSGTQSKNSQYLATSSVGGDCHLTPPHLEWSTSHETIYTGMHHFSHGSISPAWNNLSIHPSILHPVLSHISVGATLPLTNCGGVLPSLP